MNIRTILQFAALLAGTTTASLARRDHDANDYFAVHLHRSLTPARVEHLLGARHEGQIGQLEDHHTFSLPKGRGVDLDQILHDLKNRRVKRRRSLEDVVDEVIQAEAVDDDELDSILWSEKLVLRQRLQKRIPPPPPPSTSSKLVSRSEGEVQSNAAAVARSKEIASTLSIKDPIYPNQWHLFNDKEVGNDLNVTGLWLEGITGNGSITAIVDDGLDMYSNDLKDNYFAPGSYDFNDKGKEPRPRLSDDKHGTRCAGEVAAGRNDACGVGVAYDGQVSGIRILSKPVTDEDEASAINYRMEDNQIYSCSWGPVDDGATMDAPGLLIRRAMLNAIQKGRDGKGSIFVFAAGNGAASGDNCNFDGYTNSIYSITVGAIDRENKHPYYSESCSAQLVVTYSSGGDGAIHTTDVGADTCSTAHGGTSAAGPLVAGVSALLLSMRPELTWRDVQHLMVETAVPLNEDKEGWQTTANGKKFSHDYGFGKVDAYTTVQLAKEWKLVKPQAWFHSPWLKVYKPIPQGDKGLSSSFEVTKDMLKEDNLERVEHVTVTMNANHTRRGDLSVELHSPSGVISYLSVSRRNDMIDKGYEDWTFMSVAHWGESGIGKWTVIVRDTDVNDFKGSFTDWQLTLWGESIDPKAQKLHPLPDPYEHDHDMSAPAPEVGTTSVTPLPSSTPTGKPTDNPDRPNINAKPTGTSTATGTTGTETASSSSDTASAASSSSVLSDNFLPSPFPTFGVSKATQIWIYGAFSLIIIFCLALGAYFLVQRRKRIRNNPRDDYEFEIVADDESGFPLSGGAAGGKKQRRRGGELYDAFAGDSDEEIFSEDEKVGLNRGRGGHDDSDSDAESYHDDRPSASDSGSSQWNEKAGHGGEETSNRS